MDEIHRLERDFNIDQSLPPNNSKLFSLKRSQSRAVDL